MADIVLINPRHEISTYGLDYALPIFGAKAPLPPASLALLAAVTPEEHRVRLIDENVEPIDFDACKRADIVGLTGIVTQRVRMKEILEELKRRGVFAVVGGAWISVRESYFGSLADVIFVGEAEETWPRFLSEWQERRHAARYEQVEKTDLSALPTPRFDLLKMKNYLQVGMQFSRGCPFACEFCDIIVVFGRRPRVKRSAQVIAELDALRQQGVRSILVADDNFVSNKKAIKAILREVIAWQRLKGYPLEFVGEASLDLADDPEMLELMSAANFAYVFVGIETPSEPALRETKKLQNLRKGGTMLDKVHRIQAAGLEVLSGMILGFDNDGPDIFDQQCRFIRDARIVNPLVNILFALPKTPLYARLEREGRIDPSDEPPFGTNIEPRGMSRQELYSGAIGVMRALNDSAAYFDRLDSLLLDARLQLERGRASYLSQHPLRRLKRNAAHLVEGIALFMRLMWLVPDAALRRDYRRRLFRALMRRCEPTVLRFYAIKCAIHYHLHVVIWRHHDLGIGSNAVVRSAPAAETAVASA